jgi:hypothetical protein
VVSSPWALAANDGWRTCSAGQGRVSLMKAIIVGTSPCSQFVAQLSPPLLSLQVVVNLRKKILQVAGYRVLQR